MLLNMQLAFAQNKRRILVACFRRYPLTTLNNGGKKVYHSGVVAHKKAWVPAIGYSAILDCVSEIKPDWNKEEEMN